MVTLRDLRDDDVDWIFDACQDPEIQRWTYVPTPYQREHAEAFVAEGIGEYRTWVVESGSLDRPAGLISVHDIDEKVASIGYWVAPWARGHGVGSGAVELVVAWSRLVRIVTAVTACIAEANVASRRTVERCGFTVARPVVNGAVDHGVKVNAVEYRLAL